VQILELEYFAKRRITASSAICKGSEEESACESIFTKFVAAFAGQACLALR
jgi:hypothetical protein